VKVRFVEPHILVVMLVLMHRRKGSCCNLCSYKIIRLSTLSTYFGLKYISLSSEKLQVKEIAVNCYGTATLEIAKFQRISPIHNTALSTLRNKHPSHQPGKDKDKRTHLQPE
jgi:hypothetical protein